MCMTCGSRLGFDRGAADLVVLDQSCAAVRNRELAAVQLAGRPGTAAGLCGSCELTRTRPTDGDTAGAAPLRSNRGCQAPARLPARPSRPATTPRTVDLTTAGFDLLSSAFDAGDDRARQRRDHDRPRRGHDPHREAMRVQLAEPYRTLLGHLRHEIGHWYWDVLIDGTPFLDRFRDLFGDEQLDYAKCARDALRQADDRDWEETHVSHYAAAHPWEDWAETFAHYLHIRDTMQTARAWGMHIDGPDLDLTSRGTPQLDVDPIDDAETFDDLARAWVAFTFALNAVNRSMGHDALYPFVLPPKVLEKMRFVHVVVRERACTE